MPWSLFSIKGVFSTGICDYCDDQVFDIETVPSEITFSIWRNNVAAFGLPTRHSGAAKNTFKS